jgi:hypothetical protein
MAELTSDGRAQATAVAAAVVRALGVGDNGVVNVAAGGDDSLVATDILSPSSSSLPPSTSSFPSSTSLLSSSSSLSSSSRQIHVVSSDLSRARDTAKAVARACGNAVVSFTTDVRLRERALGPLVEGKPLKVMKQFLNEPAPPGVRIGCLDVTFVMLLRVSL